MSDVTFTTHGYYHAFVTGERGFNYYDGKWGTVIEDADDTGWFRVRQDDGQTKVLNAERFVQPHVAELSGYGSDPRKEES